MNIQDIIQRIKKKDRKAERELFDLMAKKLFGLCRRYARDDAQAKDYLQEAFLRVFDKIKLFEGADIKMFNAWFYRVSVNAILSIKRKEKRQLSVQYTERVPDQILDEEELDLLSDEDLINCIRRLPEGYRNVINLFVFEKMSHKEIAQLLGVSESTSRSQYLRAKKLLKKILIERIPNLYEKKLA